MPATVSATPLGAIQPGRQSAMKWISVVSAKNVSETAEGGQISFRQDIHGAANLTADADLHSRQRKDESYGRDFGHERDFAQERDFDNARGSRDPGFDSRPRGHSPNRANNRSVRRTNRSFDRGTAPDSVRWRSSWRRWVRVFIKWFLLLGTLAAIGYSFWRCSMRPPTNPNPNHYFSDVRISELEDFLKRTTKMMQVQLELVDMKIGVQIEGLRKQLEERIAEQTAGFYTELRDLRVQTSEVEPFLLKLRDLGLLRKEEVVELVNHVVDARAREGEGQALSLDDVRAVARRTVEVEIQKHAADGSGRVDYALSMGGGRVIQHSKTELLGHERRWRHFIPFLSLLREHVGHVHAYAAKVLEPSFGEPGQCLPLKGHSGFVDIALRESVFVEAVTLEHVAKSVAYDRSSAVKDFRIFGWLDPGEKDYNKKDQQIFLLGEFSYDLEKSSVQTFVVPTESTGKFVNTIRLEVLSNHGSDSHTCIYRFRVHGSPGKVFGARCKISLMKFNSLNSSSGKY